MFTAALAVLLVSGVVAPSTQAAVAAQNDGPPTTGKFYIQNTLSGYNMSASPDWVATHRPKGNEDSQQWEFTQNSDGTYKVRNPDEGGRCLTEKNNPEGDARLVLGSCDADKTDWEFRREAGEKYRIFVPGTERKLWGEPVLDSAMQVKITDDENIANEHWYVTPIDPPHAPMPAEEDRTLDDVTFLTTHNSFYNTEDSGNSTAFPNQPHSIARQLNDGARGLMLDAHYANGRVRLCHGSCLGGAISGTMTFSDKFADIVDFLKANPKEIVTIFLEDDVTAEQLDEELGDDLADGTDAAAMVFRPDREGVEENGWPTVQDMVKADKRLLLFTSDTSASSPDNAKHKLGFMAQKDWTVENHWSMGDGLGSSDWSCYSRWDDGIPLSREEPKFRRLFVMNHFRDVPMSPTYTEDNKKLQNRAERFCMPAARKKPNYLAIDEYKDGDPMSAVDALNQYTYHGDTPEEGGEGGGSNPQWKEPRLTVMPLGDSITEGAMSSTDIGYRAELYNALKRNTDSLDFVGSLQHGPASAPDRDHEGHSGWRIDLLSANINSWLVASKPNVITLMAGTNDINQGGSAQSALSRMDSLLGRIHASAPDMTVLLGSIAPVDPDNARWGRFQPVIDTFNAGLPGLVDTWRDKGMKVRFVDNSAVTPADISSDGLHPKDSGYTKMARAFYDGIGKTAGDGWISRDVPVTPGADGGNGLGDYQV
ncbi:MAG: GDSL-type esterase/lipase family protein, partial [Streptomyces sp.]|nr:GDSL-type esterase/lipase family protein [Streptomyces sp.]